MTKNITELGEDTKLGLDVDGDGKPDFHINLKTIGMVIVAIVSMTMFYMQIQADIEEAKQLPVIEIPPPEITRMEFDMKDQLVRQTIMDTQKDVEEIKKTLEKIEDKLYGR